MRSRITDKPSWLFILIPYKLSSVGVCGDEVLEGNEEAVLCPGIWSGFVDSDTVADFTADCDSLIAKERQ